MTTPSIWNANLSPLEIDSPATPANLEDRFWAAFDLRIDDGFALNGIRDQHTENGEYTMLFGIPTLQSSVFEDDSENEDSIPSTETPPKSLDARFHFPSPVARPSGRTEKEGGRLRSKIPLLKPFVSAVSSPSMFSPLNPMKAHRGLPTPSPNKVPATPALERVSNFLHSVVHASETVPPTPVPGIVIEKDNGVRIVEQEIMVDGIEDGRTEDMYSPPFEKVKERDSKRWHQPTFGYNPSG